MAVPGIATAADYSEAIGVARRAKSVIALLLLLILVVQIAAFFLIKYDIIKISGVNAGVTGVAVTDETVATTQDSGQKWSNAMHYVSGLTLLLGLGLSVLLSVLLCMIGHIMLVGRLIGVGKVTSALVWSFVLLLFLFPWQIFAHNTDLSIPGALWSWDELVRRYDFPNDFSADGIAQTLLNWFRFVGAPLVALILVLIVQLKSNRGIRMAMGEDEVLNSMMNDVNA
ncbi:MAG TPA: hypothetical protein VGB55_14315 [Tepidisphaeraceae bacterium]|jgi:hypothetical protein